jgi:hypothetical protein
MKLLIEGTQRIFTPIHRYREVHHLPADFGVARFEPKDYTGLGSIDSADAGAALNTLRAAILAAVPERAAPEDLPAATDMLASVFRTQLYAINSSVGLKPVEIDFAVAGFADVTQNYAYALLRARLSRSPAPSFAEVYSGWLESSARVATTLHEYRHEGNIWHIRVVSHAYGRTGLVVQRADGEEYVEDSALACPAEGFMLRLLKEVCAGLLTAAG